MCQDYLMHYRTPGSKNGVRLYQYPDGTWTELGKERRRIGKNTQVKREKTKGQYKVQKSSDVKASNSDEDEEWSKRIHDIYEAAKIVNTDEHGVYHKGNPRYSNNCWSCSIAYELRRRGIPAKSLKTEKSMDPAVLRKAFNVEPFSLDNVVFPIETNEKIDALMKKYKTDSVDSVMRLLTPKQRDKLLSIRISHDDIDGIMNNIVKQGDGARGMINFRRVDGSGHIFNYEVISNKCIVIEAQHQIVAPGAIALEMLLENAGLVDFFRTDNAELSASIDKYYQREGLRK